MKKEFKCGIGATALVIFTILLVGAGIFYHINVMFEDVPKKVCVTEEKIHKIVPDCNPWIDQRIPANIERMCEEGIKGGTEKIGFDQLVYDCNFDDIERVCLYKETIETCTIE